MEKIILLFGPSLVGLGLVNKFIELKGLKKLYVYSVLLTFSIFLLNILYYFIFSVSENIYDVIVIYPLMYSQALLLSIFINIFLAIILIAIFKNFSVEVEVKNEKKRSK